jgi:ribosomal protein L33
MFTSFKKVKVKNTEVLLMAAKGPRENITLECTECKRRNYTTSKNKRNNTDRLEIVKYCKYCKKRTTHKETK